MAGKPKAKKKSAKRPYIRYHAVQVYIESQLQDIYTAPVDSHL